MRPELLGASVDIDTCTAQLGDVVFDKHLGGGRFMRSFRGTLTGDATSLQSTITPASQPVVVKFFSKPDVSLDLSAMVARCERMHAILRDIPNIHVPHRLLETDQAFYMQQTYIASNLYDRSSTRPFLTGVEKKWIAFQLLTGLSTAHQRGVLHGNIKMENVLTTSWNWAYLTDFADYKPAYIPEDDPTDFSYFFDSSARRACYLSPERFTIDSLATSATNIGDPSRLTPAMDVFALGCVLAEMHLDRPLFDLAQLLRYRRGEFDPTESLLAIDDANIRALVASMIAIDHAERRTLDYYLDDQRGRGFPEEFYTVLYPYMTGLLLAEYLDIDSRMSLSERRVTRLVLDQHALVDKLGISSEPDIFLILHTLALSCMRTLTSVAQKVHLLRYLEQTSKFAADVQILDRFAPYVVRLLRDSAPIVRIVSIESLIAMLERVNGLSTLNMRILPDFVLPHLKRIVSDHETQVRVTYAKIIGRVIRLEKAYQTIALASNDPKSETEDGLCVGELLAESCTDTRKALQDHVLALLADPDSEVLRALLADMETICVLFGQRKANDIIITHTITYLNDQDWQLRSAFFEATTALASFVGSQSLEEYLLPLIVQSVTDPEERVVQTVLNTILCLAKLELFSKSVMRDLSGILSPLVFHPNAWNRAAAMDFVRYCLHSFHPADLWCFLYPVLRPLLRSDMADLTPECVIQSLRTPLERSILSLALHRTLESASFLESLSKANRQFENRHGPLLSPKGSSAIDDFQDADQDKIYAIKDYLLKLSRAKNMPLSEDEPKLLISSKHLSISAQTAFISNDFSSSIPQPLPLRRTSPARSIMSALLERAEDANSELVSSPPGDIAEYFSTPDMPVSPRSKPSAPKHLVQSRRLSDVKAKAATQATDLIARAQIERPLSHPRPISLVPVRPVAAARLPSIDESWIPETADQNLRSLLRHKSALTFSPSLAEFGTVLTDALIARHRAALRGSMSQASISNWTPRGILVAHLHDHSGPVRHLQLSHDHAYLASSSDDGTLKIWDCSRILNSNRNKPHATYSSIGGKITAMAFLQSRHCVAIASENGQVHILRVMSDTSEHQPAVTGVKLLRNVTLPRNTFALKLCCITQDQASLVIVACADNSILALEVASSAVSWTIRSPGHYGIITAMMADHLTSWLLVGYSEGALVLYDLRFLIPVRVWRHHSNNRITAMCHFSAGKRSRGSMVAIATGPHEVSILDVRTGDCPEVFMFECDPDHDITPPMIWSHDAGHPLQRLCTDGQGLRIASIRSILHPEGSNYLFSSGSDEKIRLWNVKDFAASSSIPIPIDVNYSSYRVGELTLNVESPARSTAAAVRERTRFGQSPRVPGDNALAVGKLGTILDIQVAETPQPMLICAGYNGVISVFV